MTRQELLDKVAPKRTIPFFGKVDADLYVASRNALLAMDAESEKPITILIDSMGGSTYLSFQFGDLIRMASSRIIGLAIQANSASLTVLQYCNHRIIAPSGSVTIHSSRITFEQMANCRRDTEWSTRERLLKESEERQNAYLRRLFSKTSKLSEERIQELMARGDVLDYVIFAEEALELNLVDSILPTDYKLFFPPPFPKLETPTEEKQEP